MRLINKVIRWFKVKKYFVHDEDIGYSNWRD